MRTLINLLFFTLLFPLLSVGQTTIKGHVVDTSGTKNIEFATVALQQQKDSSIVTSAITDLNGFFTLKNVKPGRYFVNVSHMSYSPTEVSVTVVGKKPLDLGLIGLNSKEVKLKEVVISGKSTPMSVKKDTIEFNTLAYKPRENDVVEDVLKKLPGVTVDADGEISVNGKTITEVMVDGKKFFLNDPKMATQNLPADIVDRIQIVDKKSEQAEFSKIDDGDTEKIINLTLKKDKKKGFFSNVRGAVGTDDKYDASLRIGAFNNGTQIFSMGNFNNINRGGRGGGRSFYPNVRQDGIRTFGSGALNLNTVVSPQLTANGSYRFNYNNLDRETSTVRENYDEKGRYMSDNESNSNSYSRSHDIFTRFEYKKDTSYSILFSPNFQYSSSNSESTRESHEYSTTNELVNSEKVGSNKDANSKNFGFELLYRKAMKKPRETFSVQFKGRSSSSDGNEYTKQENFYAINDSTNYRNQHIVTNSDNDDYSGRMVYTYPLTKLFTLEGNYQLRYRRNKNDNNAFDFNDANNTYDIANMLYSTDYKNENLSNNLGARINMAKGKFVGNIGVNGTITNQNYLNQKGLLGVDTSMVYKSISPSFLISFRPSDSQNLDFTYSGQSKEPTIEQIRPIQNPNTPNSIVLANNELKQEFSNSFSLSYDYFNSNNFLSINDYLYFNQTSQAIVSQTYRDEYGKNYSKAVNVDGLYNIGNFFTVGKSLFNNKLQLSSTTNADFSHAPGFVSQVKYFTNQLSLGESLKWNLAFDFLEVGSDVGYNYNIVKYEGLENTNDKKPSTNYSTFDVNGNATAFLPLSFQLNSVISFSRKFGDLASTKENSVLWNASVSKKFLKSKGLDVSFIAFDILNKYKPFTRTVSANYIEESTFKTISQMFMVSVSYTLNKFGGVKMQGRGGDRGGNRGNQPYPGQRNRQMGTGH